MPASDPLHTAETTGARPVHHPICIKASCHEYAFDAENAAAVLDIRHILRPDPISGPDDLLDVAFHMSREIEVSASIFP
jgi:hypothetical protein